MSAVAGEKVVLGKPDDYASFGWDNEYGRKEIDVRAFRASRFKVRLLPFTPYNLPSCSFLLALP